jgi:hypothetical protein
MFRQRLLLALVALPSLTHAANLPSVDFVKAYLSERHELAEAEATAGFNDRYWKERLLRQGHLPSHAYTEPAEYDRKAIAQDDAFRRAAARLDKPGRPLYWPEAWSILQWDLGYTKASPTDLRLPFLSDAYGSGFAELSAVKAGVQADIFHQALSIFGEKHSTFAAKYAVAAQILRERVAKTPEADREMHDVDPSVLDRFMALPPGGTLDAYDAQYLRDVLDSEMNRHTVARDTFRGTREIGTPFRIARVAAAYRDNQSYVAPPCTDDFRFREGVASLDPRQGPMCFVDASDRAVYAWYNEAFRRQAGLVRENQPEKSALGNVLALLVPFGAVLDMLAAAEFIETLAAEDLAASGDLEEEEALAYEDRAAGLSCRRF